MGVGKLRVVLRIFRGGVWDSGVPWTVEPRSIAATKGVDAMSLADSTICQGCWDQMRMPVPIRGPLAFPLRLAGIRVSRMHPNLCTICETQFEKRMGAKQVL